MSARTDALQLYTVEDAAKLLAMSARKLYRHIASGDIAFVKIGRSTRITHLEIVRFISSNTIRRGGLS